MVFRLQTIIVPVVRPVVTVSSALAPRLAGKLALSVFSTVPRPRRRSASDGRAAALARLEGARRSLVATSTGFVAAYTFEPEEARAAPVLLVHGWADEPATLMGFVAPLLARGHKVVAIDLPGHGRSSGRRMTVPLAVDAIAHVVRPLGPLAGIIAHSLGAVASVSAASGILPFHAAIPAARLVLIGAPNAVAPVVAAFADKIGLAQAAQEALWHEIHRVTSIPPQSLTGAEALRRLSTPTLLFHDRDDRDVPFSEAEALEAAGPHVRLCATNGLGHRRILFAPDVIDAAVAHVSPPPGEGARLAQAA